MFYNYLFNKFLVFLLQMKVFTIQYYLPKITIMHTRIAIITSILNSMTSRNPFLVHISVLALSPQSQTCIVRVFVLVRDGIPLSEIKMIMERTGSSLRLKPILLVRITAVLSKTEIQVHNFFNNINQIWTI